jgi:hypothetical protein
MSTPNRSEQRGPSLWAILLIVIGVVWLLAQANIITGANLSVLFRMWPILLIGIGLELLFGRQSRALSTLIILGTVTILIVLMIVGPSLGLAANTEVETAQYSEPLGDVSSAQITVGVGVGNLDVSALTDSTALFEADIRYIGQIEYTADGETEKQVTLVNDTDGTNWFNFVNVFNWFGEDNSARWDIGISPTVPVDLSLSTGTGSADLDLSSLQLTGLNVNSGTGGITLTMPAVERESYTASVSLGTGGATITLDEGIATNLRVNSGTGGVTIDVPDDAPIRLEANTGTGGISVIASLERVSGDDEGSFVGDSGVWETSTYAEASENSRINIRFDGGTGGLNVR